MPASRRRSAAVAVGAAALVAASLTSCSPSPKYDGAAVCVDQATNKRLPDRDCNDGHRSGGYYGGGYPGWYYLGGNRSAAPVGGLVSGGSYSPPAGGNYLKGGVSPSGGTVSRSTVSKSGSISKSGVSRGGFGGSHGSVGG